MIKKKVLIVYDTRYGATEITSRDISDVLEEKGVDVDLINLKPLKMVQWPDPEQYNGIIVGSSVAMFRWKKKPKKFLSKNKKIFMIFLKARLEKVLPGIHNKFLKKYLHVLQQLICKNQASFLKCNQRHYNILLQYVLFLSTQLYLYLKNIKYFQVQK